MVDSSDSSFLALYDHLAPKIYGYLLLRTGHTQTAEDLLSSVWLKAWAGWKRRKKGSAVAWVYRIAHNALIDHYKNPVDVAWDSIPDLSSTGRSLDPAQLLDIRRALTELTRDQREIILLRIWEGLSFAEIGEFLGTSEAGAKMRFARSVGQLQHFFPSFILLLYASSTIPSITSR